MCDHGTIVTFFRKIEIVMDSHGNGLDPRRMYKNQDVNVHVLGAGKKNLVELCSMYNL